MQKLYLTQLNLSLNPGLVNPSLSHWLKSLALTDSKLGFINRGLSHTNLRYVFYAVTMTTVDTMATILSYRRKIL